MGRAIGNLLIFSGLVDEMVKSCARYVPYPALIGGNACGDKHFQLGGWGVPKRYFAHFAKALTMSSGSLIGYYLQNTHS